MKVPILIIPKSGIPLPNESSQYIGSDTLPNPSLNTKADDSHTVKQKLALRLSEKKGHDSEPSLNLLSPHSKGSTDSGYFSRSESAEQQISPPTQMQSLTKKSSLENTVGLAREMHSVLHPRVRSVPAWAGRA